MDKGLVLFRKKKSEKKYMKDPEDHFVSEFRVIELYFSRKIFSQLCSTKNCCLVEQTSFEVSDPLIKY